MANYNTTSDCGCARDMQNGQMNARPYMANTNKRQTANMSGRQMANRTSMSGSCPVKADPLSGMALAMAYVPWQYFQDVYEPDKALQYGTIFPELNKPFYGKGGCPK